MPQPRITVFTPLAASGNPYIEAAWETLKGQSLQDFEWVVLENHGGRLPKKIRADPRVKFFGDTQLEGIGALKRRCTELARGETEFLFELDHDDLLAETALEKACAALEHADFVFSDTAEFKDGTWEPNTYRTDCGWTSYEVEFQGHKLLAQPSPAVTPQNLRLIDFAPNHLRAFRKDAYWSVGGYNPELPVADDHELMLKFFLKGLRFKHIAECLYFYRVHARQTTNQNVGNGRIRALTEQLQDKYAFELADHFCTWSGLTFKYPDVNSDFPMKRSTPLRKIDLCGAIDTFQDYEPLDLSLGHDLNEPWPLANDSVGVIRAYDAIEHLKDPVHLMNEAHRVLAPGGYFLIRVPSTTGPMIRTPAMDGGEYHWVASAGRGAFQDPTHVSFWNENSFWYYTKRSHARYLSGLTARFQLSRIKTFYPDDFCAQHAIPYVDAHLIALKDGYSPMGLVEI